MRRGIGVSGLQRKKDAKHKFTNIGEKVATQKMEYLQKHIKSFKENLEKFASQHKSEINSNPHFRQQFHNMCLRVGVDPLASQKGFWAELLGVGDFYYELSVQIVHICLITRRINGGLVCISELLSKLRKMRGKNAQSISEDDINTSLQKLHKLGNGYQLLNIGDRKMVVSVPIELNIDHSQILDIAKENFYITPREVVSKLNWPSERVDRALNLMLQEELIWIDEQAPGCNSDSSKIQYWVPSFFMEYIEK